MLLDDILDLHIAEQPDLQVRDIVARTMNDFLDLGDDSTFTVCAMFLFKSPGFRVTNKTEDLIQGLVVTGINFPPLHGDIVYDYIKTDADFRKYIISGQQKFLSSVQCNE